MSAEPETLLIDHGRRAASDYSSVRHTYEDCARRIEAMLTAWLDAEGINYLVISARAKSVDSFRGKASKPGKDDPSLPKYVEPLSEIEDLAAARVITYLPESVDRTCAILRREFEVSDESDKGQITKEKGLFGYASRHLNVRLKADRVALSEYQVLAGKTFEIQVRTAAQHAWAEFEHDVRYKVAIPKVQKPNFDRRFLLAAALMEMADNEFTEIDRMYRKLAQNTVQDERSHRTADLDSASFKSSGLLRHQRGNDALTSAPFDASSLSTWLADKYGDAPRSKKEHYSWMLDLLHACAIQTSDDLETVLTFVDSQAIAEAMRHKFPPGQVRRLDDDLLAGLGRDYIDKTTDQGDQGTLQGDRRTLLQMRFAKLSNHGLIAR